MRLAVWVFLCFLVLAPALSQEGVVVALDLRDVAVKPLGRDQGSLYEARFQVGVLTQNRPWNGPIAYRAVISRADYQHTLTGQFAGRNGLNLDSFRFAIPLPEKEGPFKLQLEVTADGQSGRLETSFDHVIPLATLQFDGPGVIVEGEVCTMVVRATSGTPPFRWKWSAGDMSGEAEGPEAVLAVYGARFPKLTYAVWLQDSVHSQPSYGWHTVRVDKPGPSAEVTPPPQEGQVTAAISGPAETAVGQRVVLTGSAAGGTPPYSFQWVGDRPGGTGESCPLTFHSPGTYTVKLLATDSLGWWGTTSWAIQVYPPLQVKVAAPAGAPSGQRVQFSAQVSGGKPPYTYAWSTPSGGTGSSPTLSGTLRGKPGESRQITLVVEDSLAPPQRATATATVRVTTGSGPSTGGLRFTGNLNPATVAFMRALLHGGGLGMRRAEDLRVKAPPITLTVESGDARIEPAVVLFEEHYREIDGRGSRQKSTLSRFEFSPGRLGAGGRIAGPCRVTRRELVDGQGPPATTRDSSWVVVPGEDGNLYLLPSYPNLPADFLAPTFSLTPQQKTMFLVSPYVLTPEP